MVLLYPWNDHRVYEKMYMAMSPGLIYMHSGQWRIRDFYLAPGAVMPLVMEGSCAASMAELSYVPVNARV